MQPGMKVSLCPGNGSPWCPHAEFDGEKVILEDNDEKAVSFSKEEWNKLVSLIKDGTLSRIE